VGGLGLAPWHGGLGARRGAAQGLVEQIKAFLCAWPRASRAGRGGLSAAQALPDDGQRVLGVVRRNFFT